LTCLKAAKWPLHAVIEANQMATSQAHLQFPVKTKRVSAMFHSSELNDELQTLKSELSGLLNNHGAGMFDAANSRANALADQIKASLNELGEMLSEQEEHAEALIAERPIATMASAFALGVVIGFMLRKP
jgi:ElaB/YqjD/DUF883 family membrane-anchored ribosome-binding protein